MWLVFRNSAHYISLIGNEISPRGLSQSPVNFSPVRVTRFFFSYFLTFRLLPVRYSSSVAYSVPWIVFCVLTSLFHFSTPEDSMVSALWKACSEGDLENVHESLKEASGVDIEIKGMVSYTVVAHNFGNASDVPHVSSTNNSYLDHTGVTPLIEAVKNGHLEVVRVLLDKGERLPLCCINFCHRILIQAVTQVQTPPTVQVKVAHSSTHQILQFWNSLTIH